MTTTNHSGLTRYKINLEDGTDTPDDCGGYYRDADVHAQMDDLSTLVVRLVRELRKASPGSDLPTKALEYLYRKDLSPSVLRGDKFGEFARAPSGEDAANGATVGEANPVVTVPLLHYQDLVRKAGELRDLKTNGAIWEREAFEAWFKTAGIWDDVIAWRAWQARAALTAEKAGAQAGEPTAVPPRWYTVGEIRHTLKLMNYCDDLAIELSTWFVRHLQLAFNKGFEKGQRTTAPQPAQPARESFQTRVRPWMIECFGPKIAADREERNHRFFEESTELVQSCGMTASEAHQLVDYVYGRPAGEKVQETGGVMVTLAALCLAQGIDMHKAGETELARIWTKVDQIRAKQAAKPKHSPLPAAPQPAQSVPAATLSNEQCKAIEQAMAWAPHGSQCQSILRALLSAHNGGKHE